LIQEHRKKREEWEINLLSLRETKYNQKNLYQCL